MKALLLQEDSCFSFKKQGSPDVLLFSGRNGAARVKIDGASASLSRNAGG